MKHTNFKSLPLKIIALNTQNSYVLNTGLLEVIGDAGSQLQWLEDELKKAELEGTPVWLLGHIPPSTSDANR